MRTFLEIVPEILAAIQLRALSQSQGFIWSQHSHALVNLTKANLNPKTFFSLKEIQAPSKKIPSGFCPVFLIINYSQVIMVKGVCSKF